jgi:hypothetical protein
LPSHGNAWHQVIILHGVIHSVGSTLRCVKVRAGAGMHFET